MKRELKNNVNTLLWLMVTLSVMVMFSLVCLSSCNSSVNSNGKGGKTPDDPNIPPAQKITITYSCSDNNGTIEAKVISSKEGKIEGNKIINLVSGDRIQFTAKPNNGYKFKGWAPATLGNKETFELTVDKDLSVSVEFENDGPKFKITKDSPIVYKTSGLGFGKKKTDPTGIYYAISGYEEGKDNGLDENDLKDTYNHPPVGSLKAPFDSIHKGLETRWQYYKDDNPSQFENEGKYFTRLFNDPSYKICLKDNDLEVWAHPLDSYYANWNIVFIDKNKDNGNEGYHFTFGPYHLNKDQTEQEKEILKNNCLNPGKNPLKYRFTLDDLFKISLKNKYKINPTDKEMSEFNEFKSKIGSDYDVYLVVIDSGLFEHSDGSNFPESTDKDFCWCNVLKFNDPFWKEDQTQP